MRDSAPLSAIGTKPGAINSSKMAHPPIQLIASFSIRLSGRKVLGEANVTAPTLGQLQNKLVLTGGFCNENLIQLSYRSADPARVQYGVVLFRLSDSADQLAGNYAGFSPLRGCLIVGKFDLTRRKLNNYPNRP